MNANVQCPQCGSPLNRVVRPFMSPLNDDQFDAHRAGDWWCPMCPSNERSNTPKCYWWNHEIAAPAQTQSTEEESEISGSRKRSMNDIRFACAVVYAAWAPVGFATHPVAGFVILGFALIAFGWWWLA